MDDALNRLEQLYRDEGPSLLAYLRRRLADVHAAEDLLQETFFQAARRVERVSQAVSPRAWLFTIARNVASTRLRRSRPVQDLPVELASSEAVEDPRLERVRQVIASLPEAQRETLELRLRDALTYEEIANVLGIPIGTVRSRLHNALRHLRSELAGE